MIALEATVSVLSYIALAVLLGQLVTAGFLLPNGEPKNLRRSLLMGARAALLVFLGVAIVALVIQGAKLQRSFPSTELLWRYLTMAQSGKVWLMRELYGAALALVIGSLASNATSFNAIRVVALLAVPLVASRSLTSHAVAVREDMLIAVISDSVHLIATAVWAGGLIALWRVLHRANRQLNQPLPWTAAIVNRFSRLALVSVTLLLITGVYQSWIHVGSLTALMNTDYGNMLLLKLLLFSVMLGYGTLNFFRPGGCWHARSVRTKTAKPPVKKPSGELLRRVWRA